MIEQRTVDRPSLLRRRLRSLKPYVVKAVARGPLVLRAPKQLAQEAVYRGAVQKTTELSSLLQVVRAASPRVVVEIGTADGGTLYAFCKVAREGALLVSIDLPGGDFGGGYADAAIPRMRSFARKGQ